MTDKDTKIKVVGINLAPLITNGDRDDRNKDMPMTYS